MKEWRFFVEYEQSDGFSVFFFFQQKAVSFKNLKIIELKNSIGGKNTQKFSVHGASGYSHSICRE